MLEWKSTASPELSLPTFAATGHQHQPHTSVSVSVRLDKLPSLELSTPWSGTALILLTCPVLSWGEWSFIETAYHKSKASYCQ